MNMLRFFSGRLLRAAISLILFQIILFSLIQALPQDYAELEVAVFSQAGLGEFQIEGAAEAAEPAEVVESKTQQFIDWMTRFYRGDLGQSADPNKGAVADILATRLPKSLLLLLPGTVVGFLLGLWLGKLIAWRRRGWMEFAATLGGTAFYSSFPPWLAFVAINIFGLSLGWFPPEKLIDPMLWLDLEMTLNQVIMRLLLTMTVAGVAYILVEWLANKYAWYRTWIRASGAIAILILASIPWIVAGMTPLAVDLLFHLALPFITLVLLSFGETMLVMRTTMVEAMEADHVPLALARGLPESTVRDRHVARVAILPVLTRFIVHLPLVIIGSFVLEKVFFWDGMGQVLVEAARDNDLPILLGVLSLVAVGILVAHVVLDVLATWLDPRLRRARMIEAPL
jgi:peptide/nickel transport system permease protein